MWNNIYLNRSLEREWGEGWGDDGFEKSNINIKECAKETETPCNGQCF